MVDFKVIVAIRKSVLNSEKASNILHIYSTYITSSFLLCLYLLPLHYNTKQMNKNHQKPTTQT